VALRLPATFFRTGDRFQLDALLYNRGAPITATPLFVILDVFGEYYLWPAWQRFEGVLRRGYDFQMVPVPTGVRVRSIIPAFDWPPTGASAEGLRFWGVLTDPQVSRVLGESSVVEFGFSS
jgi:hypothetical protein